MSTPGSAPLDPRAVAALDAAIDRAQIFGLLLAAVRETRSYAAVLSVHAEVLRGQGAVSDGRFAHDSIAALRLSRSAVPAFEQAIATGSPYIGAIATGDPSIDEQLMNLGGGVPESAMVLPLIAQGKTVAVLVGHSGDVPVHDEEVSRLYPLLAAGCRALERFAATRVDAAAPQLGRRTAVIDTVVDEVTAFRRVLESYRHYGQWEEMSDAIRNLIRIGAETGDPNEDEQLELLLELGNIEAAQLDRPQLAIDAWRSALTIDTSDRRVLERLERLFALQGMWGDFVDLLERRAALADDLRERVGLLLNAAQFCRDKLLDDERAIDAYLRILSAKPDHEVATAKLEELYRTRAQWPELAAMLVDRASRQKDPQLQVASLERAAEIYEEKAEDAGAALLVWLAVIRQAPERTGLVDHLERLGPAAGAWDDVLPECAGLAEELEESHRPTATRLWQLTGTWYRDHVEDGEAAVDALERAVRITPDDLGVALQLLDMRRTVGPPADTARMLEHCARLEPNEDIRGEFLFELAAVREQLGKVGEAVASLERAFDAQPGSRSAARELRRLHRAEGEWNAAAAVLERHIKALTVDAPRPELADLHRELGDLYAEHLRRPDDAASEFRSALDLDAANVGAFQGLKKVHRAAGRVEAYLEMEEAEINASGSRDPARYREVAKEWEARERFDRAEAAWRKVLTVSTHNSDDHAGLTGVLRKLSRWDALATACRAHLEILEGARRAPILLDLASALETDSRDLEGAIAACREVLTLEVDHAPALDVLGRVYERLGRWNDALGALERLGALPAADDRARADMQVRMGRAQAGRGERMAALACFERAISLDRGSAAAHEGLGLLHRDREDYTLATHHLERAAQLSGSPVDAVRCLMEAADIYRQRLSDPKRARERVERALEIDRSSEKAREALGALLSDAGNWEALWPHLVEKAERAAQGGVSREEARAIYVRAARCAVEIGNTAKATELLDLALAQDPADIEVLMARGYALFRAQSWEAAGKAYHSLLVQHAASIDRAQAAVAWRQLALINKAQGKDNQASAFYQKVLEVDPKNRETLEDLVALDIGRKRFDQAITTLRTLADAVPAEDRASVIERIGDLYGENLNDATRSIATYVQALELQPKNRRVLQKLLDAQGNAGQWKDALATIARFIELETEPQRRGRYHLGAGTIRRAKLQDSAGALDDYERALDSFLEGGAVLDPSARTRALDAFAKVDELVTAQKDWKRQERAHRKVIKRLPKEDPGVIQLWQALGEIYRSRLNDLDSAMVAFETAHALDPVKKPERIKLLGELYAAAGKASGVDLVDRASRLVDADPFNQDALRALARVCVAAGRIDEAWCVCRALVQLKQAEPAEDELYRKYKEAERRPPQAVIDHETWRRVRDDNEDLAISAIFSVIWEALVSLRAGPPKSFDLKDKDRLKLDDGAQVLSKIFQIAARTLNVSLPTVYVQPDRPGKLMLANTIQNKRLTPTLIVGRDLTSGYREAEVAFSVASMMTLLRPAHFLRLALPSIEELEAALASALTVIGKPSGVRADATQLGSSFVAELQKRLTPQATEALNGLAAQLPDKPDLGAWRNSVDVGARRTGLLLCGELAAATSIVAADPTHPGGPRGADKVRELVSYSVSSDYFEVRRHLGVSVAG